MTTNLSGSLSEFSLAEVLSLLGMGGRTARMQVASVEAVGTVHLVDGRISSATADSARAGLLRRVVAALPVPADDLAQALQAEDPVRALVDSGVVDRDAAQQVASEHCIESVGEMLGWTSGEFAVWVGSADPSDVGVRLEVDELVGAARERAQQWHDLRAALPESESVLALVPDVAQAPVLDTDDWSVLAKVDGRRTLAEVLSAMGASPLAAGDRLVQLMGRGLVAVQVSGGDAEREQQSQLLDAFDAGGPVDAADEVIARVAAPEPALVPEVHDLFGTEPEAVEEWQVAGAEPWVVSEPEPAVTLGAESVPDPAPVPAKEYAVASEWAALVAPEFPAGPEAVLAQSFPAEFEPTSFELEPTSFELEPTSFEFEPTSFELEPVEFAAEPVTFEESTPSYEVQAPTYDVEAEIQDAAPVTFDLEPVAEPAAESFAWSPWAQEMGLGEAPVVAAAAPESLAGYGFADMVESPGGHGDTDAFPVPQAPVSTVDDGHATPVEFVAVDEVGQYVPQPRDPGDVGADPSAFNDSVGVHAASPEYVPAPESQTGAEPGELLPEPAPDPLAGGLLAHLMSSVRGL